MPGEREMGERNERRAQDAATRSHEEIQALLRAEIDQLRASLDSMPDTALAARDARVRREAMQIQLRYVMEAAARHGPPRGVPSLRRQRGILARSGLFDADWYLKTNEDVAGSGMKALDHYMRAGAFEGRDPGPDFDTMGYYLSNPDVAAKGWPALVHYEAVGRSEGRTWA